MPDPFDLDDDDEADQESGKERTPNALAAAQRKLSKAEKELEELRAYKAEQDSRNRSNSVEEALKGLGVPERRAKYYPADADVTADAVRAWAVEEEFISLGENEAAPAQSGFTPTVVPEGQSLGGRVWSAAEWRDLARTNPAEAQRLHAEGRVNLAALREGIGPDAQQ